MMPKKINIRPTTGVYATYKNIKYDPWTAIAEFVDNSTQSYYDHKDRLCQSKNWAGLNVEIHYEKDAHCGDRLIIRDNAYGMNFDDFKRAIILDSPPKKTTRSEFGMGLKTAACWFGRNWSVESIEYGSEIKYKASVDVDALHKYKAEEIEVQESACDKFDHGTTITIWNMNRTIVGRQIGKTKDQLRGMYRVDLRTGDISIKYNGESLFYEEPQILTESLPDGTQKIWKKKINFTLPYNGTDLTVKGFVGLLDTASTSGAGFALIRKGRVIIGGYENAYRPEEIFDKPNSFVYQRLFGELHLDNWPVTQTKDAFDWFNGLEDALIEQLSKVCKDYKKKAREYRKSKKTKHDDNVNKMVVRFKQAGIIKRPKIQTIEDPPIINGPDLDTEGTMRPLNAAPLKSKHGGAKVDPRDIVIEDSTGKKITFKTASGTKYIFNVFLKRDDQHQNWLFISPVDEEKNEYNIEWNIRHPFFKPFIDEPDFLSLMEQFIFAFALSEIETIDSSIDGQAPVSAVRLKMNDILKDIAKRGE